MPGAAIIILLTVTMLMASRAIFFDLATRLPFASVSAIPSLSSLRRGRATSPVTGGHFPISGGHCGLLSGQRRGRVTSPVSGGHCGTLSSQRGSQRVTLRSGSRRVATRSAACAGGSLWVTPRAETCHCKTITLVSRYVPGRYDSSRKHIRLHSWRLYWTEGSVHRRPAT